MLAQCSPDEARPEATPGTFYHITIGLFLAVAVEKGNCLFMRALELVTLSRLSLS